MGLRRTVVTVTGAAGENGAATANATSSVVIEGYIRAVYLSYTDSPPAGTTDVTIAEAKNSPAMSILTVTNGATNGWFFPLALASVQAGTAMTDFGVPIAVADYVKVTIAQANANDGVTATLVWEEA